MKKFFYFLVVIGLLYSCNKRYDEDPLTTHFISLSKRLVGTWNLEKIIVSGIDSSSMIQTDSLKIFSQYKITSLNEKLIGTMEEISTYNRSEVLTVGLAVVIVKTANEDDKETIGFMVGGYPELEKRGIIKVRGAINDFSLYWNIAKLTKDEMHLWYIKNGIEYHQFFRKK